MSDFSLFSQAVTARYTKMAEQALEEQALLALTPAKLRARLKELEGV